MAAAAEPPLVGPTEPPQQPRPRRRLVEYYAEENFKGADLSRHVHIGWGAMTGGAFILFCMGMSAATQASSWNVSFRWLQRRVGAQFGTMSYIITTNLMYYHDGSHWQTRDWQTILERWTKKKKAQPVAAPP